MDGTETSWMLEAVHGAEYVHVDEDTGRLIAWRGAGIFNVYRLDDGKPIDCFVTDGAPGPEFSESRTGHENSRRANHGDAMRWAELECLEYLEGEA